MEPCEHSIQARIIIALSIWQISIECRLYITHDLVSDGSAVKTRQTWFLSKYITQ